MNTIKFLTLHRKDRSPGQRFRFEQYLDMLQKHGFRTDFRNLLNERDDQIFYKPSNLILKIWVGIKAVKRRLTDVLRTNKNDVVFIFRDAFFFGVLFEKWFRKKSQHLVFDFDDSIWLPDINPNQGVFNKLKNPDKIKNIIEICDLVIAGNEYLANYARQFNPVVTIIPTTIDTNEYQKPETKKADQVCIGWSGSFSTIKHFETVVPALKIIKEKYGDQVCFSVIGDANYKNPELGITGMPWAKDTEIEDLSAIDIGLMPLPNDEWSKGKCGLKGLQYMALEIATIMSPVGVNSDIIHEGENGFLASDMNEWVEKIAFLIENPEMREKAGKAGRKTVIDHYSVTANEQKYLKAFQSLLES